jgi:hypothetical protein
LCKVTRACGATFETQDGMRAAEIVFEDTSADNACAGGLAAVEAMATSRGGMGLAAVCAEAVGCDGQGAGTDR